MLQIREDGSFGQPNSMRLQDETSSANGRPCSEDTSTRNVNRIGKDMVGSQSSYAQERGISNGKGNRDSRQQQTTA